MKKFLLFFVVVLSVFIVACNKTTTLPNYTPTPSTIFSVSGLNHTEDTVNVGDTIYLVANGVMYDTTQNIYTYLSTSGTASGVSTTFNYGSSSSPIKLTRTIGAQNAAGLYTWTSTILLPGATWVPSKTKLTIVGNFIYQLSLSSQLGTLSATDAGQKNKTVYVQ
ncbi:MAG TPA: hypothetical protein VMH01_10985 [Puia sp.]|nr:hypothetical protein [Puia sp.]